MENIEIYLTLLTAIGALVVGFWKQLKAFLFSTNKVKKEELELQAAINEIKNNELKEAWETVKKYQEINRRNNQSAEDQLKLLNKRDNQLAAYRLQLDEQDEIIFKLRKALESEQAYVRTLKMALERHAIHKEYLENLLRENEIEFKELKTQEK